MNKLYLEQKDGRKEAVPLCPEHIALAAGRGLEATGKNTGMQCAICLEETAVDHIISYEDTMAYFKIVIRIMKEAGVPKQLVRQVGELAFGAATICLRTGRTPEQAAKLILESLKNVWGTENEQDD